LKETLNALAGAKVLVVGDLMLDRYHWGQTRRISPEAPVPVVKIRREETRLGGAANVANNLAALGCKAALCGLVGADAAAGEIKTALERMGLDASGLVADPTRPTSVKVRVMAQNQQLLRLDWEEDRPASSQAREGLLAALERLLPEYDGVIVSDYGKGVVTPEVLARLVASGKPVVVDPKGSDYSRYRGVTCLTPNEQEAAAATGIVLDGSPVADASEKEGATVGRGPALRSDPGQEEAVLNAARMLLKVVESKFVCITRGPRGVLGLSAGGEASVLPARAREVFDVTGAGDTFISVLGALLIAGREFGESLEAANAAAGLVVGKLGTATVTPAELLDLSGGSRKVYGLDEIGPLAARLREAGRRIVFTNGCFDLLHAGHIQYLQASRERGDLLVVGLNSDESVKRLKGPSRPVIGEEDRAHLLAALACVDYVVIFEEDTPLRLIGQVRPHVLTKGADYTVEGVVGHEMVGEWGGVVELIELKENRSTSGLIEKIVTGSGR